MVSTEFQNATTPVACIDLDFYIINDQLERLPVFHRVARDFCEVSAGVLPISVAQIVSDPGGKRCFESK